MSQNEIHTISNKFTFIGADFVQVHGNFSELSMASRAVRKFVKIAYNSEKTIKLLYRAIKTERLLVKFCAYMSLSYILKL